MMHDTEAINGNFQITVEDLGPKVSQFGSLFFWLHADLSFQLVTLGTANSNGFIKRELRGNYVVSNLFQELHLAKLAGHKYIVLDEARLNENPVDRLARQINHDFWGNLSRRIDGSNIEIAGVDPKDWTGDPRPRIYVPIGAPEQLTYYTQVAKDHPEIRLEVISLPKDITEEVVRDMNAKPGLLAIAMEEIIGSDGKPTLQGIPFVVPGGRFNELYGWDSFMETLGLLENGKVELAKGMVEHFIFCIIHYGKILNANRSYYLCRSQPPFLTDMAFRVFMKIQHKDGAREFLRRAISAAIKEYETVWTVEPRLDPETKLSRYRPQGLGVPPETEATHFTHILEPYAKKHGLSFDSFVTAYNSGDLKEHELDEYFLHDRAVRESGHDTSYRLEKVAANLATIDLNALLYKYETDIASIIDKHLGGRLVIADEFLSSHKKSGHVETSGMWTRRARERKAAIDKYLWNEKKGMYFDYDTVKRQQCEYVSATTFWALYAGVASPKQAQKLVDVALPLLEEIGGLASGTEKSRGIIGLDRPNRQWDWPYGWAPQQILAWIGLERYNHHEECTRLAYKWLYMVTATFVNYNGVIVEKYDVTSKKDPHRVDAEYGNQGLDFKGVAKEGFGWVNASYVFGLTFLGVHAKRALGTLTDYDSYHKATSLLEEDESVSKI